MTRRPGFVAVITVQSRVVGLSFSVAELMTRVVLFAFAMAFGTADASAPPREECPLNSAAHARDVSALAFEGTVTKLEVLENYERMATLRRCSSMEGDAYKKD